MASTSNDPSDDSIVPQLHVTQLALEEYAAGCVRGALAVFVHQGRCEHSARSLDLDETDGR
jgi:hypothetical protein